MVKPEESTSHDEEILGAESPAVPTLMTDDQRVALVDAELHHGFDAMRGLGPAVTIFGSARTPADHPEYADAREVARRLGEAGYAIITGGGPGAMQAANEGAKLAGVRSVGLDIELPHEQGMNPAVDLPLEFHYFFTRKVVFVRYAAAFVCMPGGYGTLDELFEVLTLRQTLKIRARPVILFGSAFWDGVVQWLAGPVLAGGKIDQADIDALVVTDSIDDVVARVRASLPVGDA